MKLISIIMVTYNFSKFIVESINSVLRQSFRNFELVVVDDESTDNTFNLLEQYSHLSNFSLIKHCHTGNLNILRNSGLSISKGDFIAFIDADDIWFEKKLELQMVYIDNYDMICSNAEIVNEKGDVYIPKCFQNFNRDVDINLSLLVNCNYIFNSSVLFKKSIFKEVGLFDETKGVKVEDYPFWLKVAEKHRIRFIDKPLIKYRRHPNQLSFINDTERIRLLLDALLIRKKYFDYPDVIVSNSAKNGCNSLYAELVKIKIKNRQYNSAREYCSYLIKGYPHKCSVRYVKYILYYFVISILATVLGNRF